MIQVRAQAGGGELIPIDPRIIDGAMAQAAAVTRGAGGALAWPALLRRRKPYHHPTISQKVAMSGK